MSTRALFQVLRWKLPATQKLVAIFVGDQANDDGECWFTLRHACSFTSLSDRAIQKTLISLEAQGKIKRISRPGRSNRIILFLESTPERGSGVGGERGSGRGERGSGGGERGSGVYKEKSSYSPYLPSQGRLNSRDLEKMENRALMKLCRQYAISTHGESREQLLQKLLQRLPLINRRPQ